MARKLLLEGFTTVRNMGSTGGVDLALKRDIDRGWIPGPRIVVSLEPISVTGGHSDPRNGIDPDWTNRTWGGSVADGPEEFATGQVREHRRRGAEIIKIMPSGGVLSIGDDPKVQTMTDAEIKSAIDTAHNLGLKVAAHAHGKAAIDSAVRNGVDSIEHGTYADAESFQLMKEHGTYLVPTLLVADQVHETGAASSRATQSLRRAEGARSHAADEGHARQRLQSRRQDRLRHRHLAWRQRARVHSHGLRRHDARRRALRRHAQRRRPPQHDRLAPAAIRAGCFADMIAVKGDPLKDITTMEHVAVGDEGRHRLQARRPARRSAGPRRRILSTQPIWTTSNCGGFNRNR